MTDETTNRGWYLDGDGDLQYANPGHVTDGDYVTKDGRACFYGGESFAALVALVCAAESAPTAPADDLPPGVYPHPTNPTLALWADQEGHALPPDYRHVNIGRMAVVKRTPAEPATGCLEATVTDETTNPNRWTAEVGGAGRTRYVDVFDGGECLDNVECYSRKQAESLAEQINRPAPTAPADDLRRVQAMQVEARESQAVAERHRAALTATGRCLIAAETLDRDHLDDLERNNVDPQSRRLKETIDRRRAELGVLRPAAGLPPGVERTSDGALWIHPGDAIPDGYQLDPGRMWRVVPIIPAEPATEWVPWWEAPGRAMPDDDNARISGVRRVLGGTPEASVDGGWCSLFVDADGKVEVQR